MSGQFLVDVQNQLPGADERFIREYRPTALSVANRYFHTDPDLADQVTTDVLCRMIRNPPIVQTSERGLILCAVLRECHTRSKRNTRRRVVGLNDAPEPQHEIHPVDRKDEAAWVRDRVAALPEELREVVEFRYFAECSTANTAEALNLPEGTVKTRLAKALRLLRSTLANPDTGGVQS